MTNVYYTSYQRRDWLKLQALRGAETTLARKRNIFLDCGLRDAAERVMDDLAENLQEQRRTEEKLTNDRRRLTREMIKVFLVAYLAYSLALDFEDLVRELTGAKEDDLSADMKNMVKACTEVAMAIDKGAGDERQVSVFGDLTDDLEDWFKEKMSEELESIISCHKQYDKIFS